MNELAHYRAEINQFMKLHPESPLEPEERGAFTGLAYYDFDPAFVHEVNVERYPANEPLTTMQTSTGDSRQYRRWGHFPFAVEGQTGELTIYADTYGNDLFMPFKDSTNGDETYGTGRYMDNHRPAIQRVKGDLYRIDFNFCYNPYCAYSPYFSCPLPPRENWLKLPIRAGEKDFH
ncbi:MAG: DUF1684 domain-containing protein [Candidatus Promineifilaceae bacterium]